MHVAVIGAGMGGLTAALALQQAGVRVTVHEQAPELKELGAGLTLAPNATRVYRYLGLEDRLRQVGVSPTYAGVRHYQTGEMLVYRERGRLLEEEYGAPYIQLHRADLHTALVDAVTANDPDAIKLNHSFVDLQQDASGVQVEFASGETAHADVVVGADGVRSAVRGKLFGHGAPKFTGHVAWRGLVQVDSIEPGLVQPDSGISIGPKQLFTRYYVRNRTLINVVAFARMDGWEIESWSEHADMEELYEVFAGWNEEVTTLIHALPPELCFKWALFGRKPLQNWTVGRVTLLGDAAHPMLPFLGMGAATAIEDGLVIARCFAQAEDPDHALTAYQAERLPRGNFIMQASEDRVAQLQGDRPEGYTAQNEVNEESLGLFKYDASAVAV